MAELLCNGSRLKRSVLPAIANNVEWNSSFEIKNESKTHVFEKLMCVNHTE